MIEWSVINHLDSQNTYGNAHRNSNNANLYLKIDFQNIVRKLEKEGFLKQVYLPATSIHLFGIIK